MSPIPAQRLIPVESGVPLPIQFRLSVEAMKLREKNPVMIVARLAQRKPRKPVDVVG